jgi:hypothetical protein
MVGCQVAAQHRDRLTTAIRLRYCNFNPDTRFASCDVPQELPTHEIDNIDEEGDITDVRTQHLLAHRLCTVQEAWQWLTRVSCRQEDREKALKPAPNYPVVWQRVSSNIVSHRRRKVQDEDDIMICQCPPIWRGGDGCGPDCINRLLNIECVEVRRLPQS